MTDASTDEIRSWGESALYWEKHFDTIREMFAPVSLALIEDSALEAGNRVLDVAGGSGEPSLTVAAAVAPGGTVFYSDPSAEMLAAARRNAVRYQVPNICFCQTGGDRLPFLSDHFDAVVCRFGAMFFPDPAVALQELLRVARPGTRVALAVWDTSEANPFHHVVTDVLARYIEPVPPDPDAMGAFRFAESGKLEEVFKTAGAGDVREHVLKFHISAQISIDGFWALRSEMSGTLRDKLKALPEGQSQRIATEVKESAAEYALEGGLSFPASVIVVSGESK
jgi:SAM-dependent methyltransferase